MKKFTFIKNFFLSNLCFLFLSTIDMFYRLDITQISGDAIDIITYGVPIKMIKFKIVGYPYYGLIINPLCYILNISIYLLFIYGLNKLVKKLMKKVEY